MPSICFWQSIQLAAPSSTYWCCLGDPQNFLQQTKKWVNRNGDCVMVSLMIGTRYLFANSSSIVETSSYPRIIQIPKNFLISSLAFYVFLVFIIKSMLVSLANKLYSSWTKSLWNNSNEPSKLADTLASLILEKCYHWKSGRSNCLDCLLVVTDDIFYFLWIQRFCWMQRHFKVFII